MRALLVLMALCVTMLGFERGALAYPFMIRHGYSGCATCHSDPSGGALLARYGRAQSDLLLSTRYGREEEPSRFSEALFGLASLPDGIDLGADLRNAYLWSFSGEQLVDDRFLQMRADLMASVHVKRLRAYTTFGYNRPEARSQSERAFITRDSEHGHLVMRELWAGVDVGQRVLLRGGRMNLPFGLRTPEHNAWVRAETQTDINQHQQYGASVVYDGPRFRGEWMAIAGNFQLSPDRYRERGFSAYLDMYLTPALSAGVSSLVTHARTGLALRTAVTREAYGVFARAAVVKSLALLGELDLLIQAPEQGDAAAGHVSLLQADWEPVSGLHLLATGETLNRGDGAGGMLGGWLSAWWFFLPHFDVRADYITRAQVKGDAPPSHSVLVQLHAYL